MDSTIIHTHRYFDSEWFQCCLHRFGSSTTLKTTTNKNQTHLLSLRTKNVNLTPPKGTFHSIFFKQNFTCIILGYRWVDLDTYIGHTTHLKKWSFFHQTPYRGHRWLPIGEDKHNNQPKIDGCGGSNTREEVWLWGVAWGMFCYHFRGNNNQKKNKANTNLLIWVSNFFLTRL